LTKNYTYAYKGRYKGKRAGVLKAHQGKGGSNVPCPSNDLTLDWPQLTTLVYRKC